MRIGSFRLLQPFCFLLFLPILLSAEGKLLDMVRVEGGTFQMGSEATWALDSALTRPVHSVTVSSFYISKYEVTQSQYKMLMGANPSTFKRGPDAPNRPVETVSWFDAVAFCNALSDLEGLEKVYKIIGTKVTPDWTKNGYRLPTEAEWEYAARGGTQSKGYLWAGSDEVLDVAWIEYNSGKITHPAGTKAANELGLYDMSGNVWEFCWDWWGERYSEAAQTDPRGPADGTGRTLRGGTYNGEGSYAVSTSRLFEAVEPGQTVNNVGFRPVRRAE